MEQALSAGDVVTPGDRAARAGRITVISVFVAGMLGVWLLGDTLTYWEVVSASAGSGVVVALVAWAVLAYRSRRP